MAAEKFKSTFLTGIVAAGFSILVIYVVFIFTNLGERILNAAPLDYVKEQDAKIVNDFEQYKTEHAEFHEKQNDDIIQEFDTIKNNQTLIINAIKEK